MKIRPVLIAAAGLGLALVFACCAGHDWASPGEVLRAIGGDNSLESRLLVTWRLPRALAAALVGALLGLSGAIFQGVFRNPLAEPYLLGSSGGAAIGATVALLAPIPMPSGLSLAVFSFAGAWGATWLVLAAASVGTRLDTSGLLLAGVAVAAVLGAARSFLMLALSDDATNLQVALSWTLGGIQTPGPTGLAVLAAITAAMVVLALTLSRGLDLTTLGDEAARSGGMAPERFSRIAILIAAATVAAAVAWGGLVAFVGLIAPHVARWLAGGSHARLLPTSACVGAIIVAVCDGLARSVLPPAEIPLGLITALAGGPFFLLLLRRRGRQMV
ncbi:MAG TPA: iron ABC transporter permease [Hansschlegelia sp.]